MPDIEFFNVHTECLLGNKSICYFRRDEENERILSQKYTIIILPFKIIATKIIPPTHPTTECNKIIQQPKFTCGTSNFIMQ